ncbi:hypothetical protein ACFE04_028708 [Oxalis oulophora]
MASGVKNTKRCSTLFLALLLMASVVSAISRQDQHKVPNLLKRLNKHAVKSIKSDDGDTIDCVKLADQPAFDHPLLINHTIQLSPTSHSEMGHLNEIKQIEDEVENLVTQSWQLNGSCPEGTIPIKRTNESEILRVSNIEAFGKKKQATLPRPWLSQVLDDDLNDHEYAYGEVEGKKYYGTKATFNVWNPYVQGKEEFSLSQMWLVSKDRKITIEAGWHKDGYAKTGCYNLQCPGFVQTNKKIVVGGTINHISTYGGRMYDITLHVWKDHRTKNWWLKFGKENVGYWPASLFTFLPNNGMIVQWGGEIINDHKHNRKHTRTQMGSGHFAYEGYGKASFIKNIKLVDASNILRDPTHIRARASKAGCYNVKVIDSSTTGWGKHMYFGGPGQNQLCH